ncbi:hypothetical protein BC936DRAFT_139932 [Jimgerdemannia flammicorona]|uniref:DH domain-containing protein n=1 Tax=Jimgerdemannia flammicorona TaxID=994334 RepID=A0A433B8V2_9FUNG|nr:hypothetical protein BC936DRAFT_139932 [Jimgerdemannia flammicorona]
MPNFECYSKFLLGAEESQAVNVKEQKTNGAYRNYLAKAKEHPDARRQTIQDLLVQPGQRIARYTLLLEHAEGLEKLSHWDGSRGSRSHIGCCRDSAAHPRRPSGLPGAGRVVDQGPGDRDHGRRLSYQERKYLV